MALQAAIKDEISRSKILKTIVKNLDEYDDIHLYSQLYFGSQKQEINVLFDTGSSWLWVLDNSCLNCDDQDKFYNYKSSTYTP
jgi:hypothetical protein